jgi:CMP-N-acetylneuraminic acid synthetase
VVSLSEVTAINNYRWQITLKDGRAQLVDGTSWANVIPRRQELDTTYVRNGLIYLFKTPLLFTKDPSLYGEIVQGYVTEDKYSMEIDTEKEWVDAESKFVSLLDEQV